jgi:lysophospholipase L1-like esterase
MVIFLIAAGIGWVVWYRQSIAPPALVASGAPVKLAVLGDSLAAGVGASQLADSLPYQLGSLSMEAGHPTKVADLGTSGATLADLLAEQIPALPDEHANLIVVVIGANDVLRDTLSATYQNEFQRLVASLVALHVRTVILNVPALQETPAIPLAYKMSAGQRARQLNQIERQALTNTNLVPFDLYTYSSSKLLANSNLLSPDEFHPNDAGYKLLAQAIFPLLELDKSH